MTLTTLEAEDDRNEQSLQKYPDSQLARAGSRSSVGDAAPPAYAEQTLFVPECRHPKSGQLEMSRSSIYRPCTKISSQSGMREREDGRRRGLLRRHPFAFSIGLLLLIPIAAVGYLYWDQSRHFEFDG